MRQDQPQRPDGSDPSGRMHRWLRTASFWALLILIPVALLQFMGGARESRETLSYTQFRQQITQRNIESIQVRLGTGEVEGSLRSAITVDEAEIANFHLLLPTREISDALMSELLEADITIETLPARSNWLNVFISILPWIFIIGLWLFVIRQMQAGGSRAFSFGKSKARLLSGDTPKITFADVAGCDEAKDELQEIIEFLKDPRKFSRLGGRLPKGALLVGPPGTGKTLLARAVAGEAGRPFFSMSGSDFVEMFVGVGASRVRDLFEQGKAQAPCIIFIDEIDAVGRHRGAGLGGGHDEREQTLNQLLVEMDGFESNEGVILLAATNRPDVLDPALLRPGRFDRQIVVDNPDIKGREGIFQVHTQDIPLADDVDLAVLAKGTPGLSGADIENVVNEAALIAARDDKDRVYMEEFERAKDKVMLGTERRSMVISEEERRVTAYHEAGHAVVALRVPGLDPLHKVTIVPRGRALGITASLPEEDRHNYTKEWLEGQLKMLFGGRVAEETMFGDGKITTGAGNDIERATDLARRMVTQFGMSPAVGAMSVGDREQEVFLGRDLSQRREVSEKTAELVDGEIKRILDESYDATRVVLDENQALLEAIAEALLERETLDSEDIKLLEEGKELPALVSEPAPPAPQPAAIEPAPQRERPLEGAGGEPAPAPA
ncbi:ATP-dependent zinc metalloprotease FtsH [Candidatus Palauibacter soopunensis]|uniref:ATP-dependent zinc metalloprotease FtsH n=1 Tax=Candidatus Palauibacter soopunensis TaxID=3056739 RepID=UPI0028733C82|nr:ATP-dependent zinc metalloprotease FtsH [Candidatus Palauibacter soopunensis]